MNGSRLVQLVGIGDLGREFVEYSLAEHPRQARYCSVEAQREAAIPSPLAHRIFVTMTDAGGQPRRNGSLQRRLRVALSEVDLCVLAGRCDDPFASDVLPRAVTCAKAAGCLVIVIVLLPYWSDPFDAWRRAAITLHAMAGDADYILPFPLSRTELWPSPAGAPVERVPDQAPRLPILFESLDPIVAEALRPETNSLFDTPRAEGAKACLTVLRTVPVTLNEVSGARVPWLGGDALTQLPLMRTLDRRVIALGAASELSLVTALEIAGEIDDLLDPDGREAASLTARRDDRGLLLLFASGQLPKRLLHLFRNPGSPEARPGTLPANEWGVVEPAASVTLRAAESRPFRLLDRGEEHLDLGDYPMPSQRPISAFYRISPGAPGLGLWTTTDVSIGKGLVSRSWFGMSRLSWPSRTRPRPAPRAEIAPGSFAARIDSLATSAENSARGLLRWAASLPRGMRERGIAALSKQGITHAIATARLARVHRIRVNVLALTLPAILLITPIVLAALGVATLASMSHAVRLSKPLGPEAAVSFQTLDSARIVEASNAAKLTRKPFDSLGLSGSDRVALATHLDLLAVKNSFFGLETLGGGSPPFLAVNIEDTRAQGRLANLLQSLASHSESRGVALNALGFFPSPEELARLSGGTVSDAAIDLNTLSQDAEGDTDQDDWAAGCGTALQGLRTRFALKRDAPNDIELPDRSYLRYLGFLAGGGCSERRAQADAAYEALSSYSKISVRRVVVGSDALGQPMRVRYSVIVPNAIREDVDTDEAKKPDTPLALYASGLRHLYLLEFDPAQRSFDTLAHQPDRVAAALGAYLMARTSFWKAAFATGGYRPDLYPLSVMLGEDNTSSTGSVASDENSPRLALCRKGADQADGCVRQTYDRPATGTGTTVAAPSLVAQARAALQRVPIIKSSLLDKYDGTAPADGTESDQ